MCMENVYLHGKTCEKGVLSVQTCVYYVREIRRTYFISLLNVNFVKRYGWSFWKVSIFSIFGTVPPWDIGEIVFLHSKLYLSFFYAEFGKCRMQRFLKTYYSLPPGLGFKVRFFLGNISNPLIRKSLKCCMVQCWKRISARGNSTMLPIKNNAIVVWSFILQKITSFYWRWEVVLEQTPVLNCLLYEASNLL